MTLPSFIKSGISKTWRPLPENDWNPQWNKFVSLLRSCSVFRRLQPVAKIQRLKIFHPRHEIRVPGAILLSISLLLVCEMEVVYRTKLMENSLDFIDDKALQSVLEARLDELERVFGVNGNLSTIILAISCIEGIFRHLAEIFKKDIRAAQNYPLNQKGKKKRISDLTIEEMYTLLIGHGILLQIQHFDYFYDIFRNYRNFIHPQAQRKQPWPVGLGQAQMAIGLLNSTIDQLSKYIFIGHEILEKISGRPRYDLSKVHHLDVSNTRTHSFVTLKRKIHDHLDVGCELELGKSAIFNFVFNFVEEGDFSMVRLDNRNNPSTPNALLSSKQRHHWYIVAEADRKQPPEGLFNLEVKIDTSKKLFLFNVNGAAYSFANAQGAVDLFSQFRKGLRVGWFNEIDPVKIMNLKIQ
jgi:hypothetical protein